MQYIYQESKTILEFEQWTFVFIDYNTIVLASIHQESMNNTKAKGVIKKLFDDLTDAIAKKGFHNAFNFETNQPILDDFSKNLDIDEELERCISSKKDCKMHLKYANTILRDIPEMFERNDGPFEYGSLLENFNSILAKGK